MRESCFFSKSTLRQIVETEARRRATIRFRKFYIVDGSYTEIDNFFFFFFFFIYLVCPLEQRAVKYPKFSCKKCPLALKVFDRKIGCRQWSTIFVAVEVGQCYPVTVQLLVDQCQHSTRTSCWTIAPHYVCHCTLFHDDLHDIRRLWKRRGGDRQREDIYHLHDDNCRYELITI